MKVLVIFGLIIVGFIGFSVSFFKHAPYGAVVFVQRGDMMASGVYLGHGFVLTAAHVSGVEDKTPFLVNGHPATALWTDKNTELGLLLVEGMDAPAASLSCGSADLSIGDRVEAVGNPYGIRNIHTTGIVASDIEPRKVVGTDQVDFLVNALVAPGMSGGPIFDRWGHVAGIMSATVAPLTVPIPLGFIIPRSVICKELKRRYGSI